MYSDLITIKLDRMTDYIKQLESKVKDCKNTNTIFDKRKYVLLEDAKEILSQALTMPVVAEQSEKFKCDCGCTSHYKNNGALGSVVVSEAELPEDDEEPKCPDHTPYWGVCGTCGSY